MKFRSMYNIVRHDALSTGGFIYVIQDMDNLLFTKIMVRNNKFELQKISEEEFVQMEKKEEIQIVTCVSRHKSKDIDALVTQKDASLHLAFKMGDAIVFQRNALCLSYMIVYSLSTPHFYEVSH